MTNLIFGIGIGLFLILSLWLLAGTICLISLQTGNRSGLTALGVAAIITIALVSVPKSSENTLTDVNKLYDQSFIWQILLVILLAVSSIVALLAYVKFQFLTPVKVARVKDWVL